MRLFLLTTVTMLAFAANSVLNRAALAPELGADRLEPWVFAAIRLLSGALCLLLLIGWRDKRFQIPEFKFWGIASLSIYAVAFSMAYISLPTGIGALILFGVIQLVMFAGALIKKEHLSARKWMGASIAFTGLVWLLWPTQPVGIDPWGAALMLAAGIGWGVYSLLGRASLDALADSAANFFYTGLLAAAVLFLFPAQISLYGCVLAVASGAVTSGMGYALWYSVLPHLSTAVAGIAQLSVPVLAAFGGLVFLSEAVTWQFILASAVVLGGIGFATWSFDAEGKGGDRGSTAKRAK